MIAINNKPRYLPVAGETVTAKRAVKNEGGSNTVIGPVIEADSSSCLIITNQDTTLEKRHRLTFDQWLFEYLFDTDIEM